MGFREYTENTDFSELQRSPEAAETGREDWESIQDIPDDYSEESSEMQEYQSEITEGVQDIPDDVDYDEMAAAVPVDEMQDIPADVDIPDVMNAEGETTDIPDVMGEEEASVEIPEMETEDDDLDVPEIDSDDTSTELAGEHTNTEYLDEGNDTRDIEDILDEFGQGNWENLSDTERQEAIAELGEYAAADLGIKNKPDVIFYSGDASEYGYYTEDENAVYININNMDDAAEVADTITHETRHCYQHQRAESPKTEEDLAFRDNFDNYITPDMDFEAYEDQIVEADARDYGQKYKDMVKERS